MAMARFPHLQLIKKDVGTYRPKKGAGKKEVNPTTQANLTNNRQGHGNMLLTNVDHLSEY